MNHITWPSQTQLEGIHVNRTKTEQLLYNSCKTHLYIILRPEA